MKPGRFCYGFFSVVVLASTVCADDTLTVTPASTVAFGVEGGDTFGIEAASGSTATVLVRPGGETCTLRFPLQLGERVLLRAATSEGDSLLCAAALVSIEDSATAKFSYQCSIAPPLHERKCPPEASSASATPADK